MNVQIKPADLAAEEFVALVERHVNFCDGTAPAESCHRLPISALAADDVTVWQAEQGGRVVGMGALKKLSNVQGEIKSMHTMVEARGLGIGQKILSVIIDEAKSRAYESLWLETGIHEDFSAARKLYGVNGFECCTPFADYKEDPHSLFMTLDLNKGAAS